MNFYSSDQRSSKSTQHAIISYVRNSILFNIFDRVSDFHHHEFSVFFSPKTSDRSNLPLVKKYGCLPFYIFYYYSILKHCHFTYFYTRDQIQLLNKKHTDVYHSTYFIIILFSNTAVLHIFTQGIKFSS